MESANIYNHLQDHQLVGSSSSPSNSSLANTSYGVGTTHASWSSPYSMLNTNGLHQQECNTVITSLPFNSNMAPDLSFHWANNSSTGNTFTNNSYEDHQDLQNPRAKQVFADNYYLKYTEMLSSGPPSTTTDEYVLRNEQPHDVTTKLLLKSSSSPAGSLYCNNSFSNNINGTRGFSQIFPSVNVSNLNHHQNGMTNQGSFDMNLQALDLLTSSRFSGSFSPSSHDQTGSPYGFDHIQQQHEMPFYSSNKMPAPSTTNGLLGAEGKRSSNKMDQPKAQGTATKKTRVEARASCPPFKVRKEKLGDRIAALQQLVSPFGKTDTASVLMEATGYIRFLQEQVETLSVPYMKKPRKNAVNSRAVKVGGAEPENNEELKRDLRSRGLCLVPLSCLSYITDGGGGGVWPPPPHFGGAA